MSDRLTVDAGTGAGAFAVDPAVLDALAARLARLAADLAGTTADVLAVAGDPVLAAGAVLAPASAAGVAASLGALVLGRSTPAGAAAALAALAVRVESAALRYRVGDEVADAALALARRAVAEAVVQFAPEIGAGAAALVGVDVLVRVRLAEQRVLAGAVEQVVTTGRVDPAALGRDARARFGAVDDEVRADLAGVGRFVLAHPEIAEQVVAGTPHLLDAVEERAPLLGVAAGVLAPEATAAGGVAGVAGTLTALGAVSPLFRETAVRVQPLPGARATPSRPPRGVAEVLDGVAHQSTGYAGQASVGGRLAPAGTPGPGGVRLERITGADGRVAWVVEVPGTQDWTPLPAAGGTPMDLTTNLRAVAGQPTATADAVVQAMRRAGVGAGEPVLIAGHSQGGLTAAALAADPAVRAEFAVTHVVTAGSPIDGFEVPATVRVLSLEHTGDLVPALDGEAARGSRHRVVVARDVTDDPRFAADVARDPLTAHEWSSYLRTAQLVDASTDPALRGFRDSASAFLDAPGAAVEVFDYRAERVEGAEGAGMVTSVR